MEIRKLLANGSRRCCWLHPSRNYTRGFQHQRREMFLTVKCILRKTVCFHCLPGAELGWRQGGVGGPGGGDEARQEVTTESGNGHVTWCRGPRKPREPGHRLPLGGLGRSTEGAASAWEGGTQDRLIGAESQGSLRRVQEQNIGKRVRGQKWKDSSPAPRRGKAPPPS